jgi:hypothetical protein
MAFVSAFEWVAAEGGVLLVAVVGLYGGVSVGDGAVEQCGVEFSLGWL